MVFGFNMCPDFVVLICLFITTVCVFKCLWMCLVHFCSTILGCSGRDRGREPHHQELRCWAFEVRCGQEPLRAALAGVGGDSAGDPSVESSDGDWKWCEVPGQVTSKSPQAVRFSMTFHLLEQSMAVDLYTDRRPAISRGSAMSNAAFRRPSPSWSGHVSRSWIWVLAASSCARSKRPGRRWTMH